jgi:hypothetical protein
MLLQYNRENTKIAGHLYCDIFAGATIFDNDSLSQKHKDNGYRVIKLTNIQNNEIYFKDCLFYNSQDFSKNRCLLQDNNILISSRGDYFQSCYLFQK